jgi:acyl-ACP thioesterase
VPLPEKGRRYSHCRTVRLGDVTASGRLRLDALARYLQDVAGDDVRDAGIDAPWVMRRLALDIGTLPRFGDRVELVTFCSGMGGRWAERRTTLSVDDDVSVESAAIWVYVDARTGRPIPLEDWFFDIYGESARGRRVSGHLRLPPPADPSRRPWPLRVSDVDVLGHVNNAAHWEAVEEALAAVPDRRSMVAAELEHRAAIDPGETVELLTTDGGGTLSVWLTCEAEVRSAACVHFGEPRHRSVGAAASARRGGHAARPVAPLT